MTDGIQISIQQVKDVATTIRSCNVELTERLEDISAQMNSLPDSWNSDASTTILERFNALKPRFEEYEKVVEAYAQFLDQTAEAYDETETNLNNNASQFL